jgi:hypothetical protein
MTYEYWRDTCWKFGSSTDELRARRAWVTARASLQTLVINLVRDRYNDNHLAEACAFLVEVGKFFEAHPELEPSELPEPASLEELKAEI